MDKIPNIMVLLGGVRSGTTVFRQFLATHPKLMDYGEVFNSNNLRGFYPFLLKLCETNQQAIYPENQEKAFSDYLLACNAKCGGRIAIIDVKYEHLRLLQRAWELPFASPLLLELVKKNQYFVINLRRHPVDAIISNYLAMHRGVYHKSSGHPTSETGASLTINPRAFTQQIRQRIKVTRFISRFFFSYKNYLQLDYENLFEKASGQAVFSSAVSDKIARTFDIENAFDRRPKLQKIIGVPKESLISNFGDLAEIIERNKNCFGKRSEKAV